MDELIAGYRDFREGRYADEAALYRRLGERGQKPHTMVIACCDSRVDPATIFSAGPGQLFVLRNVANLVPPGSDGGHEASTAAAVEFAVLVLGVQRIVVLGHGDCGGVKTALAGRDGAPAVPPEASHTGEWIRPVTELCHRYSHRLDGLAPAEQGELMELETIRYSLGNLKNMPTVRKRVDSGDLTLLGAHFGIASGRLLVHDPATGTFTPPF